MDGLEIPPALIEAYRAMSAEDKASVVTMLTAHFSALPPPKPLSNDDKQTAVAHREAILTRLKAEGVSE